jgi:carcinoembryonic antigen-related cell adhesion molecule
MINLLTNDRDHLLPTNPIFTTIIFLSLFFCLASLSTCYQLSQVKIESLPQKVAVGKSVLLLVHNLPEDFQAFFWYKSAYRRDTYKIVEYSRAMDTTIMGSAYSLREFIYNNGSMLIIDVTVDDAGFFMLEILRKDFKIEKAYIQLHVNSKWLSYFIH